MRYLKLIALTVFSVVLLSSCIKDRVDLSIEGTWKVTRLNAEGKFIHQDSKSGEEIFSSDMENKATQFMDYKYVFSENPNTFIVSGAYVALIKQTFIDPKTQKEVVIEDIDTAEVSFKGTWQKTDHILRLKYIDDKGEEDENSQGDDYQIVELTNTVFKLNKRVYEEETNLKTNIKELVVFDFDATMVKE